MDTPSVQPTTPAGAEHQPNAALSHRGYSRCFAGSPSPLGQLLTSGCIDASALAEIAPHQRACLIAAAGSLLEWMPDRTLERLNELAPRENGTYSASELPALSRNCLLLGYPGKSAPPIPIATGAHSLVTAPEWSALCQKARRPSSAPDQALSINFKCCGLVYRCASPVDKAKCCPRCQPLFAPSDRVMAPHEHVIDDILRTAVTMTLEGMLSGPDPWLAMLTQAVRAEAHTAQTRSVEAMRLSLQALPGALQEELAPFLTELAQGFGPTENPAGREEAQRQIVDLKRSLTRQIPSALADRRRGPSQFLPSLFTILSSLVALERSLNDPDLPQIRARLGVVIALIRSGQLATRTVGALINSGTPLVALGSPEGGPELQTFIAVQPHKVFEQSFPGLAPLLRLRAIGPEEISAVALDAQRGRGLLHLAIQQQNLGGNSVARIAATLGCAPAFVLTVLGGLQPSRPAEELLQPRSETRSRRAHQDLQQQAQNAAKAAARMTEQGLAKQTKRLKGLVRRFKRGESLDFHEVLELLGSGAEPRASGGTTSLGRSLAGSFVPPPPLETFDYDAAGPEPSEYRPDWCWQQALLELFFGAARNPPDRPDEERRIRSAKAFAARLNRGLAGDMGSHHHAYRIRLTPNCRWLLEAQLLAGEAPATIDELWKGPPGTAQAYRDVFFDPDGGPGSNRMLQDFLPPGTDRDPDFEVLESYLKKVAFKGPQKLRAAVAHLQRTSPGLIPLPGPPLSVSDDELLEADFCWVHFMHPVSAHSEAQTRFLVVCDEFLKVRESKASPSFRKPAKKSRPEESPAALASVKQTPVRPDDYQAPASAIDALESDVHSDPSSITDDAEFVMAEIVSR